MDHLLVDPVNPDPALVARAAGLILAGGVVAYPTDTLYGLAVDPRNAHAIERLFAIKDRAVDQPVPVIAADSGQVERGVGHLSDLARRLAVRFWPGPLTLIVQASPLISPLVHRGAGAVAVRVPDHAVARMLAAQCGGAITSTSANRSGEPAPDAADRIAQSIRDQIDMLLDAGATPGGLPSTIVNVMGEGPVLVREGVVRWARVLECV
jgi:L-threonylcarbamoyladenylate synthase